MTRHPYPTRRPSRFIEPAMGCALAVAIGAGFAWSLVVWWS